MGVASPTEQIKERLDIVSFLKEYLELKPAGKNWKALCPFHKETNPSFMVSPERQSWYCFGGCGEGGDIFSFLMKFENIEFYEALKVLAEKVGVELKQGEAAADYRQLNLIYEVNEAAKEFFKGVLRAAGSEHALQYLIGRGLEKEIIDEFELGCGPSASDQLLRHLIKLGFAVRDIERAGLIFKTDRGTYWDRFRSRIMFPIYNSFGKVVGFTARILEDRPQLLEDRPPKVSGGEAAVQPPKYINSSESQIFNKSRLLYGLHKTKKAIRDQGSVLLVEGQMDFLMTYQDGVRNVVATSGTALTADHLRLLRRLADKLIVAFDVDEAGKLATERSLDLAAAHDFSVSVFTPPVGLGLKDPADIVRTRPGVMVDLMKQAQPAMRFYFNRYLPVSGALEQGFNKKNLRLVLEKIKNIFSPVERAVWLKELAARVGVREEILAEELEVLPATSYQPAALGGRQSVPENKPPEAGSRKLAPPWRRLDLIAQRIVDLGGQLPAAVRLANSVDLALRASWENSQLSEREKASELESLGEQLKVEFLRDKQRELLQEIAQAEREGKEDLLVAALRQFDNVSKEFHTIINAKKERRQEVQ